MKAQKHLFEIIETKIEDKTLLVEVVCELLGICTDSAYRRIRGKKELEPIGDYNFM